MRANEAVFRGGEDHEPGAVKVLMTIVALLEGISQQKMGSPDRGNVWGQRGRRYHIHRSPGSRRVGGCRCR